jgi:hypothetical protein
MCRYDIITVIMHEFNEIFGFQSGLGKTLSTADGVPHPNQSKFILINETIYI